MTKAGTLTAALALLPALLGAAERTTYAIDLDAPVPVARLAAALTAAGLTPRELIHVFAGPEGELTVGHVVSPARDLAADDLRSVQATLADLASKSDGPEADDPTAALVAAARVDLAEHGLLVTRAVAEGPSGAALDGLGTATALAPAVGAAKQVHAAVDAACNNYFVAAVNRYEAGPSAFPDKRAIWQWITWDAYNWNALRACGSNVTYEQEFVTRNDDHLHYFGDAVDGWSSSLPSAYLDTRFSDSDVEHNYAIGTSDATKVNSYTTYSTYMRLNFGNASWDTAKITGQRGTRIPSWCHSPLLCIWPQATEFIAPAWQIWVPGTGTYNH